MEKKKPVLALAEIKNVFAGVKYLGGATTASAFRGAQEAGLSRDDMITVIQSLRPVDFYKSMTTYTDAQRWQDVYHAQFQDVELYLKFTRQPDGTYLLLSFKEK
jgi:motility quorum-sensing regulator / GCU-specific mRNA interferase toxin